MASIGARLGRIQAFGFGLFVVAVCIAGAVVQLSRATAAQHYRELQQMTAIQEIADLLSENRIAEADLLFHGTGAAATALARRNRDVGAELRMLARHSAGCACRQNLQHLQRAWRVYDIQQRQWANLVSSQGATAGVGPFYGTLWLRYREADDAADALVVQIKQISAARAVRVRDTGIAAAGLLLVLAVLGAVLGLLMRRTVRGGITEPLAVITHSLSKLAAGHADIAVTGGERHDEIGALVRALDVFRRYAQLLETAHDETRAAQADAENLARNDVLTGLPNRRQFVEALTHATQTTDAPCAVLIIDLDRFKPINDVYGHEAGDMVLCELADRFVAHRKVLGSIARLGGDEFAVVVSSAGGIGEATNAARLIKHLVAQPIEIAGATLEVGATIGIALYPQDGASPSALMRAANLAMYRAKTKPIGPCQFFETSMQEQVQQRALLDADLRRAVAADEIHPYYQSLVSLADGAVVGFEILARWHHPSRGLILPDQFIEAADERGLLTDMTYRILRQACEDARQWPKHLTLSLNLAPSQLSDPLLAMRLMAILTQTGMAPERIEIEVTENALITDLATTKSLLSSLQSLGMTVALDDFGTGYASFCQLRNLKFDKIKIDRSFVDRLAGGEEAHVIVRAVIGLAKGLGLKTTAEGIEDYAQQSQLSEWGCDFGQGYLFGKAMTAAQATAIVCRGRPASGALRPPRMTKLARLSSIAARDRGDADTKAAGRASLRAKA